MTLLYEAQRVLNQGERGQPQEVHLEQLEFFQAAHVELGDNFVAVGLVEWNQVAQRKRRNHHARGVHRTVARQAFQAERHLHHIVDSRVFLRRLIEARFLVERLLQGNVEGRRHHFGEALHVGERHFEHAAHVLDGGARAQRIERDDLRHLLAAVLLRDVLDHFAAAVHAEIHVHVGEAHALRIEEALEQQAVLQRVDIGDLHRVADQAAGSRPAARSHRDPHVFGIADEIPDHQEVAGEFHVLDHLDFAIQALHVFGEVVFQRALDLHRLQARAALLEAHPSHVFKVGVGGVLGRNIEAGERVHHLFQLDVAALCDLPRAVHGVLEFAEELHHFVARLEVEVRRTPAHAVRVVEILAGLDAHEDFVRPRILFAEVVRIVGGDEREAGFAGKAHEFGCQALILLQVVVLHFEEEILGAEDVAILVRHAPRIVVLVGKQSLRNVAAQAGRHADQALGMRGQQVGIDARLIVEALQVGGGHQLDEIAIPFLVFAEQHQVVVAIGIAARLVSLLRNVHLAADYGMNAGGLGGVIELHRSEEIPVIGHRHGGHLLFDHDLHQLVDIASAVKQRVVGVAVQMDEGHSEISLPRGRWASSLF